MDSFLYDRDFHHERVEMLYFFATFCNASEMINCTLYIYIVYIIYVSHIYLVYHTYIYIYHLYIYDISSGYRKTSLA